MNKKKRKKKKEKRKKKKEKRKKKKEKRKRKRPCFHGDLATHHRISQEGIDFIFDHASKDFAHQKGANSHRHDFFFLVIS